jgi:hypothetical protein
MLARHTDSLPLHVSTRTAQPEKLTEPTVIPSVQDDGASFNARVIRVINLVNLGSHF